MHRAHTEGSAALSQVELQRHAQLLCPAHPLGAQPALRGGYRAGAMGGCVKTLLKHALLVRRVVAGARGVHYALGEAVAEGCAPRQRTGTAVAATLHAELRRREEALPSREQDLGQPETEPCRKPPVWHAALLHGLQTIQHNLVL